MTDLLQLYIDLLRWDIENMSEPWMYVWLCIPIMIYIPFFLLKWTVLTAPFWIPIGFVAHAFKK